MRTRTHGILTLTILLVLATTGVRAQQVPPDSDTSLLEMYTLKYCPAGQVLDILDRVIDSRSVNLAVDDRSNRLLVTAPRQQLERIDRIVSELDVPTKRDAETPQMLYRVYMLEPSANDRDLRAFSLTLVSPEPLQQSAPIEAIEQASLQVSSITQEVRGDMSELRIEGRAPSKEAVREFLLLCRDTQIQELHWENESSMADLPAAQITALSAPLQSHIHQLLGQAIQTVGYWFGSLSLPGEATAPLGAWKLSLEIEPTLSDELQVGVSVTEEAQVVGESLVIMEILSNHIQAKIGKPIIIGYNRDRYGSRTMGALVIVAEEDTTPISPLRLNTEAP